MLNLAHSLSTELALWAYLCWYVCCILQVTGDASEAQILLSVETYVEAVDFLVQSLNDLFVLAKENTLVNHWRALDVRQIECIMTM